jgi:hypothetical protein
MLHKLSLTIMKFTNCKHACNKSHQSGFIPTEISVTDHMAYMIALTLYFMQAADCRLVPRYSQR